MGNVNSADLKKLVFNMNKIKRILIKQYLKTVYYFNAEKYKVKYPVYLKKIGLNISDDYYHGGHGFIHPSVIFDGSDFSMISLGRNTTISLDVYILTHDFSISKGLSLIGAETSGKFLKPVSIGENCFIGMKSILLPGTTLGNNVIVGAGSVVKGKFPDGVVIAGNPAKIICTTEEWAKRHYETQDYIKL